MPSPPTTTRQPGLLHRYLVPASSLMGILALTGGIYGLRDPLAWSGTLGIATSSPAAIPYISFTAARNLGSGISILALCARGNAKALGVVFMTGCVTAFADAWICTTTNSSQGGGEQGKAIGHAVMGVVLVGWGAALWWA